MKSAASRLSVATVLSGALALSLMASPAVAREHSGQKPSVTDYGPDADYPVTVGDPYTVEGVTYTPSDTLNYDAVGYARAGTEGSGISGAHHTLPLPCYVEVTALDTGHTILVRLDRRGPMNGKALIELTPAAWTQLGLNPTGDAPVRVRRVNPPEQERLLLRMGRQAPARMDTPPGLLSALKRKMGIAPIPPSGEASLALPAGASATRMTPPPAPKVPVPAVVPPTKVEVSHPVPTRAAPVKPALTPALPPKPEVAKPDAVRHEAVKPLPKTAPAAKATPPAKPDPKAPETTGPKPKPHGGTYTVQVGAYSSRANAEKVATAVGGKVEATGKLWRVRIPAASSDQASAALAKAKHSGYAGAVILHGE
ncbi:SPOR domain-containing protein [Novosphingobium nitrogenifigens]|uniref:SPOR domain-containing protein n=1 Tax=Novosphingobium nitrogenifigens TaxID=378548 RepID=UPI0009D7705C|nr:SPOR domain-containing protein [Novosphingobium nitrogenifigens]